MKKLFFLSLSLLLTFTLCTGVEARVKYDTSNNIIYDNTIRGQKRAAAQEIEQKRKIQAAAAARIDYEQALKEMDNSQSPYKSTFYQDRVKN